MFPKGIDARLDLLSIDMLYTLSALTEEMPLLPVRAREFLGRQKSRDCMEKRRKYRTGFLSRQGVDESLRLTPNYGTKLHKWIDTFSQKIDGFSSQN